jgi:hypothetical protein
MRRQDKYIPSLNISSPWVLRISNAEKYYRAWESKFKCERLESYYEGFQWKHLGGFFGRKPYTLNLTYAAIKRKIANIVYTEPEFILESRPGGMDWNADFAEQAVQLKQDTLNTVISNPNLNFVDNIRLAALDSFFRFAVIETGYAADWRNPLKGEPTMKSHFDPLISESNDKKLDEKEVLAEERVYNKWISAQRFRVSTSDNPHLRNCNWVGYYSFMTKDVLANTKGIQFPASLRDRYYSVDFADAQTYFKQDKEGISKDTLGALSRGEVCKVWNIWDNVTDERLLLLDGRCEELYSTDFERINLNTFRFDLSLKGWYPIPPVFQWLAPQDEINESREQMRRYRRRFTRKFEVQKNAIEPDELDKFKSEEDGEIIEVKKSSPDGGTAIRPISNPDIGVAINEGLVTAKDDFNIVASNTVARGRSSDRQTATASKIQDQAEELAQSIEQIDFSRFIGAVGKETILQIAENFEEGLWVKLNSTPDPQTFMQVYEIQKPVYKWITAQEINDGYDFTIKLSTQNASPAQMAQEEAAYMKFITILTQFPMIAMSPILVRETAKRVGYKNERVIQEFQKMAMLAMMEKANMAQQSLMAQGLLTPGGPQGGGTGQIGATQPNSPSEISAQLSSQVQ